MLPLTSLTVPDERYILTNYAPVSIVPHQGFDTVLTTVNFGEAVTVKAYQDLYAQIVTAHGLGWVRKDCLESQRQVVWPILVVDAVYDQDSVVTHLIRRHIKDSFNAGALALPLQSVEYITYRLRQVGRIINWEAGRPRVPGMWQHLLKGRPGVHIGIQPLSHSILEYRTSPQSGLLMYVEAVAPDNSITCSTVGLSQAGEYTSNVYPEAVWREWRPVFIDVVA